MTTPLPPAGPSSEWDVFRSLLPQPALDTLDPRAPQAVYTPYVVTWMLVFQRLHGNASLADAVAEVLRRFPPDARPAGTPARTLSANTGAYAAARRALDGAVLDWAAANAFDSLLPGYPPSWRGRRVYILDGTTVRLAPTPALKAAYPPAENQYGPSAWPTLHLLVAHELASGLAAEPAYGPMYGPHARAELDLARQLIPRLRAGAILLADRNFGTFAVAWAAAAAGHDVLTRLTGPRFKALRRVAAPAGPGRWAVTWRPTAAVRRADPSLPADAAVRGWVHEVAVGGGLTLWLFATFDATGAELAGLYGKRQDVETDIRGLKETLSLGDVSGKGEAMVAKELSAALLAYNLATQVRRLAAARLGLEPRRLSFAGTWSLLKAFLAGPPGGAGAEAEFEALLRAAGQRKLPNRKPGRSYPREVLGRPKSKFPKRKRPAPGPPT